MTGIEILKQYNQQINQPYAQNEGTARKQIRLNRALRMHVDRLIAKRDSQTELDQLSHFSYVNQEYALTGQKVFLGKNPIEQMTVLVGATTSEIVTEYEHLAVVGDVITVQTDVPGDIANDYTVISVIDKHKVIVSGTFSQAYIKYSAEMFIENKYIKNYMRFKSCDIISPSEVVFIGELVKYVTCGSHGQIIFHTPTRLRTGSKIRISGTGVEGLDGIHYVKERGIRGVSLYQDKALKIHSSFEAFVWNSSAEIMILDQCGARVRWSDQKISPFSKANSNFPMIEFSRKLLIAHPETSECIIIDYDAMDFPFIDLTDTQTDYTLFLNPKFIDKIIDIAAADFLENNRDLEHANFKLKEEVVLNP